GPQRGREDDGDADPHRAGVRDQRGGGGLRAAPVRERDVLSRTCFIKESQNYPEKFRVKHALRAAELLYPHWDPAFAASLLADFAVPADRLLRRLSRGQLSAVGMVIGLASRAPLTLFDEPYLGLDAVARQVFYDRLLADYAEHPRTVVLSTHLIDEVSDLIEHVVLLHRGRLVIDEEAEALRGQAVAATGPAEAVDGFAAGRTELHRERSSGLVRSTILGG